MLALGVVYVQGGRGTTPTPTATPTTPATPTPTATPTTPATPTPTATPTTPTTPGSRLTNDLNKLLHQADELKKLDSNKSSTVSKASNQSNASKVLDMSSAMAEAVGHIGAAILKATPNSPLTASEKASIAKAIVGMNMVCPAGFTEINKADKWALSGRTAAGRAVAILAVGCQCAACHCGPDKDQFSALFEGRAGRVSKTRLLGEPPTSVPTLTPTAVVSTNPDAQTEGDAATFMQMAYDQYQTRRQGWSKTALAALGDSGCFPDPPASSTQASQASSTVEAASTWGEAQWKTPPGHIDVLAEGKSSKWFKRLLGNLESQFNEIAMPGNTMGCQATLGLSRFHDSKLRLNCCPQSCAGMTSGHGGEPVTLDAAASNGDEWGKVGKVGYKGLPPLCSWPKQADGNSTRPNDDAIHLMRVAPCGAEGRPFCAMIKLTKNKTSVEAFSRIVKAPAPPFKFVSGGASVVRPFAEKQATAAAHTIVEKADSMIRKAIAQLRFAIAQEEIFSNPQPRMCLPKPCPANRQLGWACEGANSLDSIPNQIGGYCLSTCPRRGPDFNSPANPAGNNYPGLNDRNSECPPPPAVKFTQQAGKQIADNKWGPNPAEIICEAANPRCMPDGYAAPPCASANNRL